MSNPPISPTYDSSLKWGIDPSVKPRGGGLKYTTQSNPSLAPPIPAQGEVEHTIARCIIQEGISKLNIILVGGVKIKL